MIDRDFYRLEDLTERWNCKVADLLRLGIQGRAQLCVNIYGMASCIKRERIETEFTALTDEDFSDNAERHEAEAHNASFERWKSRTTQDMPYGVFEIGHDELRFIEMPGAVPFELSEAFKFDGGWWECQFDPPVTINLEHLCILREEVIRLEADEFLSGASQSNDQNKSSPPSSNMRMSDARLKVIAALIEKAGINLSEPRGQAAKLVRLVDSTGYGPVSADLCERMVKAIKERMPDWD